MKSTGVEMTKPGEKGLFLQSVFSRERVARGMALAGATMCMYFVDSRFQEGPRAGLCPGMPELLALGLFLAGLSLCRWESEHTVHAPKGASAPRKGARPEREPRPSGRPEDRLPRSTERSSANGSSSGQSLNAWNQEIDRAAKAANPTLAEELLNKILRA